MLCAYYDTTCDSHDLFDDLCVANDPSYVTHLNQYNVLHLDLTQIMQEAGNEGLIDYLKRKLLEELRLEYPEARADDILSISLVNAVEQSGRRFVAIFDEWDAPIREMPHVAEDYLEFLRTLFKSSATTDRIIAAAYMMGILPIKKASGQSAVSDFWEFSMLALGSFAPYVGFLEDEVGTLCEDTGLNFEQMRHWYDGYELGEIESVYNPYAVMRAVRLRKYGSYWRYTAAPNMLLTYIDRDFERLQSDVVRLIAGEELEVETGGFQNDPFCIKSRDDALTLMIHLGYLTFAEELDGRGSIRIPNAEVRCEFEKVLHQAKHPELVKLVRASDELLAATQLLDAAAVAKAVSRVHDSNYAPKYYNDEQALCHTVKMAYISALDQYARVEELPTGHGLADVVFVPRRRSPLPAMVIELKWNLESAGAIRQIKNRSYAMLPADLADEVLLVGISYNAQTKIHSCSIERAEISGSR